MQSVSSGVRLGVRSLAMTCADHQGAVRNMAGDQWQWRGTEGVREGGGGETGRQGP